MTGPSVTVRCGVRGCNRVLKHVTDPPPAGHPSWTDDQRVVWLESCLKHGGIPGTLDETNRRRADRGMPPVRQDALGHAIPWAELAESFRQSETRGRPVDYFVSPRVRRV